MSKIYKLTNLDIDASNGVEKTVGIFTDEQDALEAINKLIFEVTQWDEEDLDMTRYLIRLYETETGLFSNDIEIKSVHFDTNPDEGEEYDD